MHSIVSLFWLVVDLAICYWIYTDAQKRGMNGILWAILTFFTCPIAPIIYFIMRKPVS
jgi:hypothetical protein